MITAIIYRIEDDGSRTFCLIREWSRDRDPEDALNLLMRFYPSTVHEIDLYSGGIFSNQFIKTIR